MNTDNGSASGAPSSEGGSFPPVWLSGGALRDTMGAGASTFPVNGEGFAIDKANAKILVRLTVDDSGSLSLRHLESGEAFDVSAFLPEGEWPQLDDPDYWQSSAELSVPRGHYSVNGSVANVGAAHSRNRTLLRYEVLLVAGEDAIDPVPPDEPTEETVVCCECGGCSEMDGNGNVIAVVDLPGESFMGQCFLKSEFEELQQQPAALAADAGAPGVSPATLGGGLRYAGAWDWKASVDAANSLISVAPPVGEALLFVMAEGSSEARIAGSARKYQFSMQLLDAEGNPDASGSPAFLKLVQADGAQIRFDAQSGLALSIRTPQGRLVSAAEFAANVRISADEAGFVQSAYSAADGLMRASAQSDGSLSYEWFAPDQVSVVGDEYQVTGDPYKTERYLATVADGVKTTVITRRQAGLPAHVVTRVESGDTVAISKGCGDEAIVRTISKAYLGNNVMEIIEGVARAGDGAPSSRTRELKLRTEGGWVLLEHTDGYGSDVARTTTYEYDNLFRVSRVNYPNGGYIRFEYDAQGRRILAAEPWAGGIEKRTRTLYSSARFYDNRPVKVYTDYVPRNGAALNIAVTDYVYADSAGAERTTATTHAAGVSHTQVTIDETYGEGSAYPYAAGKPKFSQAADGVQTYHEYAASSEHGAVHKHTSVTKADGELVSGQSRKSEAFIAANDAITFEQESVWDGESWLLLSSAAYEYDAQRRVIKTTRGNGRVSTKSWMCCGVLSETDEDGVRTDYAYDSAHQLTEESRAAVYDGDACITPETITEYVRDAAGRVLRTTRRMGAMETSESTEYDALGRAVKQTDVLGRVTTTAYSADGLTTTRTAPAGATFVSTRNTDGSAAREAGTGRRELLYSYDLNGKYARTTIKLSDGSILSQTITNGFGQTVTQTSPSTVGYVYVRSAYNAKGQLLKQHRDTGSGTAPTAPTLYEYDSFGNVSKQTLALADAPSKDNSPVVEFSYGVESAEDGVYSVTTQTRCNAEGEALVSAKKQLISALSPTLADKSVDVDVRGNESATWSEYTAPTKVTRFRTIPSSSVAAESVEIDGFAVSQKDHAGIVSAASRSYAAAGMSLTRTDGRGNATVTVTDLAGRTVSVTDAAGNVTATAYDANFDLPSVVTDALGHTACYKYDARGRKVAEWGSAIQPACFAYDDADNMTSLTTFRASAETISSDPSEREDGDTITWAYHAATGLELRKTYADGSSVSKTYDAYNRLATETDARGNVKTHSYEHARGLLLGTAYTVAEGTAATSARSFAYNHLGQLTQVTDDAGTRAIGYNAYGEQETDSLSIGGATHLVAEARDSYGRTIGYTYAKDGVAQQTASIGYGADGRIKNAGFEHDGEEKSFSYGYLSGSNLLQILAMPNGVTLTQTYELQRDLLTGMAYATATETLAQRSYAYDELGRPTTRNGGTASDSFVHNSRSELASAQVNGTAYAYDYDNIGNRNSASEGSDATAYEANGLNQYTSISENGEDAFVPQYDADGNQTLIKTSTGIWSAVYDAENRPVSFSRTEGDGTATQVTCAYDSMGRRCFKKVTVNNEVTLHERYIYRDYLQIAALDLLDAAQPLVHSILWDPTQTVATRPLAIRKGGGWYTYGWDLTKNVGEVFEEHGHIRASYSYTPYGEVSSSCDVVQPFQWSSEFNDSELGLFYYNYRCYNSKSGRWFTRDSSGESKENNLYRIKNTIFCFDSIGLRVNVLYMGSVGYAENDEPYQCIEGEI